MNAVLQIAREVKHCGLLIQKRVRRGATRGRWFAVTVSAKLTGSLRTYTFDPARYRRSFLLCDPPRDMAESRFPRQVFVVWTGDNPLTANRARNLEILRARIGLSVIWVTEETMSDWIVPGHPLHPAYRHLSLVHRSDYLRAYLMHHHGGGYMDIKEPVSSWAISYERMREDRDAWLSSYAELRADSPARLPGNLGHDIAANFFRLVGCGAMLVRSHTPFTAEWLREVERRLDYFAPQAARFPGGNRGDVVGYPVSWTDLLGKIYHPLQLKYLEHVRCDNNLLLHFSDYQ